MHGDGGGARWYIDAVPIGRRMTAAAARAAAAAAARVLAGDARVALLYLFGSAADPTAAEVEDLDLGILCEPPLDADALLRLRAAVEAAVHVAVDLVALDRAPIVLAHEVAEHGRCLFARRPELETDFVVRARARYWDFKPFLETQWRYAGERLRERRRGA
jgi:predicted nucleotidyltransferase